MTVDEVIRHMKAHRKIERNRLQERALMDWKMGQLMAFAYHDHKGYPEFEDFYSFLFDEEQKEEVEQKKEERQAEKDAIMFKLFADSWNSKFKAKEV